MDPDHRDESILTGWKEIADYLKCSVRSCLRWEATAGLPVRRPREAQGSRVIAYKGDLDAWLKARISNGTVELERVAPWILGRPAIFIWPPLVLALIVTGLWLGTKTSDSPSSNKVTAGVPQSAGPLDILPGDIVESEWAPAGLLRIWRSANRSSYLESWRIEPVRHTSLAIGDLDGDPDLEVIAPGHCREERTVDGQTSAQIRFFLNAYKVDYSNWWVTTYFDPTQCVWEQEDYLFTEIAIGDIDGRPGHEIVLATARSLSAFRYDPEKGEIRMIASRSSFIEGSRVDFRSLAVSDIDGDGVDEILATAHEGREGEEIENRGWLFRVELEEEALELKQTILFEGMTSPHALRAGDIIPGGLKEAAFPLFRKEAGRWIVSIGVWQFNDQALIENAIEELGAIRKKPIFLDVGNLVTSSPGDEIIVGRHDPNELIVYLWEGAKLTAGPRYALDHRVRLNGVQICGGLSGLPAKGGILAFGGSEIDGQPGRTYLELVGFTGGFIPVWLRLGGEAGDLPVTYAAVGQYPHH